MEEPTRDLLESALRESYRRLQSEGAAACPAPETLAALAIGEPVPEREKIADHIVSCRRCGPDYQILLRTHAHSQAALGRGRIRHPVWISAISAAAVLVAAAGGILLWQSRRSADALRGVPSGTQLVSPSWGAHLAGPPATLAWPSQAGAESYRVRLFDATGQTLWESERLPAPTTELPKAVRERLAAGQNYFWSVEVLTPLEKSRLGPFSFTIRSR
jgi:hypothetical protein